MFIIGFWLLVVERLAVELWMIGVMCCVLGVVLFVNCWILVFDFWNWVLDVGLYVGFCVFGVEIWILDNGC